MRGGVAWVFGAVTGAAIVCACGSSDNSLFASDGADGGAAAQGSSSGELGGDAAARHCDDPNAGDLQGCGCAAPSRACSTVDPSLRNRNGCHDGTQTCTKNGEFSSWGPCEGEVTACVPNGGTQGGNGGGSSGSSGNTGTGSSGGSSGSSGNTGTGSSGGSSGTGSNGGGNGSDGGTGSAGGDSGPTATGSVGGGCTPGATLEGPEGSFGCPDEGTPNVSLYCESDGTWKCFPAGSCTPAACAACLQQNNCGAPINDPSITPACKQGLQNAYNWLAGCGPDRSAYFSQLASACTGDQENQINVCKLTKCDGACSMY